MASIAQRLPRAARDDRFFVVTAFMMAAIIFIAFSFQLAMGRSSFGAPLIIHLHAVVFMTWTVLFLMQNVFVAGGAVEWHKRLGWIGAGWIALMLVLGTAATVRLVQAGQAPFFFAPLTFLVMNPLAVATFAGLSAAAIVRRRQTMWHRRLHYCGMSVLLGAAFGRLLPLPLAIPYAYELDVVSTLIFPAIGIGADLRRTGRVHPAWWWGTGTIVAVMLLVEIVVHSPLGDTVYRGVTAGTPGATIAPRAYPSPPGRA